MAGTIYRKPIAFALMATATVLVGTVVTMLYPMLRPEMHPKLESLKPFTALQLAGRDLYQREGCVNCHTQTVRPLRSEVLRYGDYSKAGEFAYDRPFLWGSKRTGPDLAREGGRRPSGWHVRHLENPQAFELRSNMPSYAFLGKARLVPATVRAHLDALGFPYAAEEIAELSQKTEMDAMVAYLQVLGSAVKRRAGGGEAVALDEKNPLGEKLYADNCAVCHGDEGRGQPDIAPSLLDDVFLAEQGDMGDGAYFALISGGSEAKQAIGRKGEQAGGMTAFGGQLGRDDIWSLISWIRSQRAHEVKEPPAMEKVEHQGGQPERHPGGKP
jgi:cytochrome c oxidase cbb3-type subunit II